MLLATHGELVKLEASEARMSLSQYAAGMIASAYAEDESLFARVRARAESTGVPVREAVERLLVAYAAEGSAEPPTVATAKVAERPASPPQQPEEETPPEPPPAYEFKSDLMRRTHGQG